VIDVCIGKDAEGFTPGIAGLAGQSDDEVDVHAGNAGVADAFNVAQGDFPGVKAAGVLGFGIDEGLHAEAYPVDAALDHGCEGRVVELAGSALDGDFSVGQRDEFPAYREEEALDETGRE
jgi:hypothetical protein